TVSPPRRRGGLPAALSVPPPRRNIAQRLSGTQPDATEAAMGEEAAGQQGGRPTHAPDTDHSQGTGESFAQRVQTLARQAVAALGPLWAAAQRPSSTSVTTERDMVQSGSTARSQSQLDAESSASLPAARQRGVLDDRDVDERYERYDQAALEEDPFRSGVLSSPRDGAHYPDDRRSTDQSADAYDAIETADHGQGGGAAAVVATQEPLPSAAAWAEDAAPPSPSGQRSEERRSPLIAWQPPVAPKRATGARARLFALVALSILLLTVVIVASVTWVTGRNNVAEAERVLDMAEANFLSAQTALDVDDKATARLRLNEAQGLLNEATTLVGTRLERADTLGALIEQELAGLLQIRPLQALAAPLVQFPPEAQPQRVVVSDQDIYILDTGRQLVQHYEMDPTNNIVMNVDGDTVLAQGDSIDGATVGRMVDITWMPPVAGVDDKAYLLVLDGSNNLFRYDNRVEGASRLDLSGREELRTPTEILVYADRLYLADAGTNQIYRYGRGDFVTPPERWFGPQTQSNLSSLRAMAIDGDIWLLYEEGLLLRYRTGEQLQFSLESSFGQIAEPVDLAVGNQSNSLIYIADSAEDRILVFNKDGGYEHQLRAPEGDVLRNLRGIAVDDVAGTMYILTQSFLFNHPIPN
ncbi:MAG: hypothetical protein KDE53_33105, partial [Caldilineaceae bacterium]|nr:hypothetical protein [Caldilineaceae bacterium]